VVFSFFKKDRKRAGSPPERQRSGGAATRQGGARASLAAVTLKQLGYTDVAVLDGGLKAWLAAGLPTTEHEYTGI